MNKLPPLLLALGVVSGNNRLLIIETSSGELELPGVIQVREEKATSQIIQLISKFGLEKSPHKTLYLPQLKDTKASKRSKIGVIQLIQLNKEEEIDVPNSWFENIQKLITTNEASPVVRAVAKWLLKINE